MAEWIPVEDRMPTEPGKYIVCAVENRRFIRTTTAYSSGNGFYMTGRIAHWKVTHWMPMPKPPEVDKKYFDTDFPFPVIVR